MQLSFEAVSVVVEAGAPQTLLAELCAAGGRALPVRRRLWSGARVDLLVAVPPRGDRVRVPTLALASVDAGVVVRVPRPDAFATAYVRGLVGGAPLPPPAARATLYADDAVLAELAAFGGERRARFALPARVHAGDRVELAVGAPTGDRILVAHARVEDVIRAGDDGSVALVAPYGPVDVAAACRFVAALVGAPIDERRAAAARAHPAQ